jgi:formylglycine-generating enzyme required for sulfatase activity
MSGNIWEWCWDWHREYPEGHHSDPKGAGVGSYRVLRGGSWNSIAYYCRVTFRYNNGPDYRSTIYGLRLVRSVE